MNIIRSLLALLSAVIALGLMDNTYAQSAEDYPNKTIRFVVPFAAGGASDVTARLISQVMSQSIGQSVIVENKVGAGGNIGTDFVAYDECPSVVI